MGSCAAHLDYHRIRRDVLGDQRYIVHLHTRDEKETNLPITRYGGSYPRPPRVELLDDGTHIKLLEDFIYLDPDGARWTAPQGAQADGASIPRFLWPILGSPLTGRYRNAAIIHDFYCSKRHKPWRAVHRMFFNAMVTSGVGMKKARLMYAGVMFKGPKWSVMDIVNTSIPLNDGAYASSGTLRFVHGNAEAMPVVRRKTAPAFKGSSGYKSTSAKRVGAVRVSMPAKRARVTVSYKYRMTSKDQAKLEVLASSTHIDLNEIDRQIELILANRTKIIAR